MTLPISHARLPCGTERFSLWVACGLALTAGLGCGRGRQLLDVAPVSGTVTLDGEPVVHARVFFIPIEDTIGQGADAWTDDQGKYVLRIPQNVSGFWGETVKVLDGVAPGKYRVTVKRRLHEDRTPLRPGEPESEYPVKESIARRFSDERESILMANVPPEGATFDWAVESMARRSGSGDRKGG